MVVNFGFCVLKMVHEYVKMMESKNLTLNPMRLEKKFKNEPNTYLMMISVGTV